MNDTPLSIRRRGLLFVLSSPSGAGKSTISRMLLESDPDIRMSVSGTTRPIRPGELDGVHYHFLTHEQFEEMEQADQFLEWAHVFGNRYGTPRAGVEQIVSNGQDVLFDIDWQGTQQLHAKMRDDLVRVFILPPSMNELERRLRGRGTDSEDVIQGRMDRAVSEISHWAEYDYVLVNDDATTCLEQVKVILAAERLKRARNVGLVDFVRGMSG